MGGSLFNSYTAADHLTADLLFFSYIIQQQLLPNAVGI